MVAVQLNSQPVSVSIGSNQYTGDFTYSLAFNNRPTNIISGVISENLQVSDTYPGDVFAIVPVIGCGVARLPYDIIMTYGVWLS